jgi:diguanylate cyclase (GGDEF)-like protein
VTWATKLKSSLPLLLLAAAIAALAAAGRWAEAPPAQPHGPLYLVLLAALGALAGSYAPLGRRTLGLAAAALPPAILFFGPVAAAWVGGPALVLCEVARRRTAYRRAQRPNSWLFETVDRASLTVLACLAAGFAWRATAPASGAGSSLDLTMATAAAAGAYLVVLLALDLGLARLAWSPSPVWRRGGLPLALDLAGWAIGLLLARVAVEIGWATALALLAALALLSFEAARLDRQRALAERRTRELREITLAGNRINVRQLDLLGIAEEIHRECRRVLPFQWFQLELLAGREGAGGEGAGGRGRSWHAGPDLEVEEGVPEPPEAPPTLPGIHLRTSWNVLERELATQDEALALLRLWCDPRRVRPEALELLDTLLPQMTASLARALLGRLALRDPLTDLPDRRAFESHLSRAFESAYTQGTAMAVLMCDIDNFKKINDLHGHATGDQALLLVARLLENHRRESDLCCRLGGDEFAVVLEATDGETALGIAERIREAVSNQRRSDLQTRIPLRLTVGVAALPELPVRSAADLLELADEALYEAKRRGRNRCLLHRGAGTFLTPDGELLGDPEKPRAKPPTLFA